MAGSAIVFQIVSVMDWLPAVVLTSKLCSRHLECTTFAILAGFQSYGQIVSRSVGVYLINTWGIRTVVPCDFSSLSSAIVLGHLVAPMVLIPFTFLLIPDSRQSEQVGIEEDGDLQIATRTVEKSADFADKTHSAIS